MYTSIYLYSLFFSQVELGIYNDRKLLRPSAAKMRPLADGSRVGNAKAGAQNNYCLTGLAATMPLTISQIYSIGAALIRIREAIREFSKERSHNPPFDRTVPVFPRQSRLRPN